MPGHVDGKAGVIVGATSGLGLPVLHAMTREGATVPDDGSYYVAPTVVLEPSIGLPICTEEVFGPLLTVEPVPSVERACKLTGALFLATCVPSRRSCGDPRLADSR